MSSITPTGRSPAPQALGALKAATALALLLGLQPVLTDLYLPALPHLARALGAPMSATQLTMAALILAFGLSQLMWGPVADRWGRRPVLLASLSLLALAGAGATLASSIEVLIAWRAAQGALLAAAVVCARAMVRDLYEPHEGARVMSMGLSGLGVLAVASPLAGGLLADAFGWRGTLAAVALFSGAVFVFIWRALPETLAHPNPHALAPAQLWRGTRAVLAQPSFRAWALLVACTYGGLFTYLSASSFALISILGFTPLQFGLALASNSAVYIVGTFVCRRWLARHGLAGAVQRGAWATAVAALGWGVIAFAPEAPAPLAATLVIGTQWLHAFGHGVHQPCGQAGAVGAFPRSAGLASALAGCALALAAFVTGLWLGQSLDGTLRPMALSIALWSVATVAVAWTLVRRDGLRFAS
jgi:DHA1 family bicyclomycin/chloramphenicol resistance-like MFS transporter